MFVCKSFLFLLIFSFACFVGVSQTKPPEDAAEKAKKQKDIDEKVVGMLDQSIAEANALRLPANRAVVYAMTADLYWKYDKKRSRELYRNAAAELVTYNQETEKEKSENTDIVFDTSDPNDVRPEVLSLIANHDPNLALELLLQTRSAALADAITKAAMTDPKLTQGSGSANVGGGIVSGAGVGDLISAMDKVRASQELGLEQRFAMMAASSDPEKAVKAIKDSLAKGISLNVVSLLNTVYKADEKKAVDLSNDVIHRIVDVDLAKNIDDLNASLNFLQFLARPLPKPDPKVKQFAFTDQQTKDIANKIANTFLQSSSTPVLASALTRSLSTLEKFVPERIASLKQRDAENKKSQPAAKSNIPGPQRFYDPNMSPEQILAEAAKLTNERDRTMAYQAVSAKIGQITDEVRAKKLIDQIPDFKVRSVASEQFDAARISRLAAADKLDEARRLISTISNKKTRIQKLVGMALLYQKKGKPADLENAGALMVEAKGLINPFPENEDELGDVMEVVRGFAVIEPDTAFRLIEPLIDQFNEMVQAASVMSKYNKNDRSFKKSELLMRINGNFGGVMLFRYVPQMQLLGKADLDRMSTLADRFARPDSRTIIKLYVLQGFMQSNIMAPRPGV